MQAFAANPTGFTVIACNALDGSAKYSDESDVHYDDFNIMKASSAVPCGPRDRGPYVIDGVPYFDGGIVDPVPVQKAIDDGYDRIDAGADKAEGRAARARSATSRRRESFGALVSCCR